MYVCMYVCMYVYMYATSRLPVCVSMPHVMASANTDV